jgi:hypothetical protein
MERRRIEQLDRAALDLDQTLCVQAGKQAADGFQF